jgi:hypothetical protein
MCQIAIYGVMTKHDIEKLYPLVVGLIIGGLSFWVFKNHNFSSSLKDIFSSIINVCGVTIGFLATVMSIIFSFNEQAAVKYLKQTGKYKSLVNYFSAAIQWTFILLLWSALAMGIDFKVSTSWHPYFLGSWLFLAATAGLSYFRAMDIFLAILRSLN